MKNLKLKPSRKPILWKYDFHRIGMPVALLLFAISYLPFALPAHASVGISKPMNNLNLVGWWRLDEGSGTVAHDFSGRRNNGTLSNFSNPPSGTSGWATGKVNKALNFDGGDDTFNAGSDNSLNITSDGTVALWVNPRSYGVGGTSNILLRDNGSSGYIFVIDNVGISNGYSAFMGSGSSVDLPDSVVFNTWQHLVITKTGTTLRFYLNGVLANTGTSPSIGATNRPFYLGSDGTTGFFDGLIDEVRVYTRALSAGEVSNLYRTGLTLVGKPSNDTVTSGMVAHWSFDGKDTIWGANTTADSAGGNTGVMTNMSTSTSPVIGKNGQALDFDGVNDYIISSGFTAPSTGTFTAWVSSDFNEATCCSQFPMVFVSSDPRTSVWYNGTSDSFILSTNSSFTNRATYPVTGDVVGWWHLAVTWSANGSQFYRDGVAVGTPGTGDNTGASGSTFYIGTRPALDRWWDGKMDDVRVYNRVLSASEIKNIVNSGVITAGKSDATSMTDGLVGYWPMDGKSTNWGTNQVVDVSGRSSNAIMINMSTTTSPTIGKIGQALKLNGTNQYIAAGNVSTLDMGTNNWTASAWVKTSDTSGNPMIVGKLQFAGGGNPDAWAMQLLSDGTLRSLIFKSGGTLILSSNDGVTVNDGKWHHVVTTWTRSGNMVRYVDGVATGAADDISSYNGQSISNSQNFIIGARDVVDSYFPGSIDDVRVYNRALSAAEVQKLYKLGK